VALRRLLLLNFFLFCLDLNTLVPDIEANSVVNTHVLIGHPYQGKQGDQIAAPIAVEQLIASDEQKRQSDVMTETVLAGEQIKKLSPKKAARLFALVLAVFARFSKNLFVGYRPRYARDWDCEHNQPHDL
jgi:hypothetical protein